MKQNKLYILLLCNFFYNANEVSDDESESLKDETTSTLLLNKSTATQHVSRKY